MYYSDITNPELQMFHGLTAHNFTIKLSDVLESPLFNVETITETIYRICPLFYTKEITSTNTSDNIIDNKVILCNQTEDETYLTFISDSNADIVDYSDYGTYFQLGDQLTLNQFNAYVSLLRQNVRHNENIRITDNIQGTYGTYEFDIEDTTILDTGIVITDETITAEPKVKLSNPVFNSSKYILQLSILHYDNVNVITNPTDNNIIVDTLEIELYPNEWVNIPVTELEKDYLISFNTIIQIDHTTPVIQDYPQHLYLTGDKTIIQSGDTLDLNATVKDSIKGLNNVTVYFYEEYEPFTISLTGDKNIIQTGDLLDLTAKLKDEDGSLIEDEEIYFYEIVEE